MLLLYIGSALLRWQQPEIPSLLANILAFTGAGLAVVGGWLGGELVRRLGVAVYAGAHLDSPNSLSGRPASDNVNEPPR